MKIYHYDKWLQGHWKLFPITRVPNGEVVNYALGLAGECGEVVDEIKKAEYYPGRTANLEKLTEELGDVLHYWLRICQYYGINPEDAMQLNVHKLEKRYHYETLPRETENPETSHDVHPEGQER